MENLLSVALSANAQAAFGRRLAAARKAKGLRQAQVAAQLGYSHNGAISNFETGKALPTLPVVIALANVLAVNPCELLAPLSAARTPAAADTDIPAFACFAQAGPDVPPYQWEGWGLVVKKLRLYSGLDQTLFGRLLSGYTRGQIARFETEQTQPPMDFWRKLSLTFGLNLTWAITGKGKCYTMDPRHSDESKRFLRWRRQIQQGGDFLKDLKNS